MNPFHVAVIVYFDVSHLVTERSSHQSGQKCLQKLRKIHRKIPVLESLHISLIHKAWVDLINAEAATGGVL